MELLPQMERCELALRGVNLGLRATAPAAIPIASLQFAGENPLTAPSTREPMRQFPLSPCTVAEIASCAA